MKRKIEQSMKMRRNKGKTKSEAKAEGKKQTSSEVGEKWTEEEILQKQKGGSRWALAEGCEVQGSLQSKQRLTEGLLSPSGWAGEGTATRGCEM